MNSQQQALLSRVQLDAPDDWRALEAFMHDASKLAEEADESGSLSKDVWQNYNCGVLNRINVPVSFGGSPITATALRRVTVFEHVARHCPGLPIGMPGPGLSGPPVNSLGYRCSEEEILPAVFD